MLSKEWAYPPDPGAEDQGLAGGATVFGGEAGGAGATAAGAAGAAGGAGAGATITGFGWVRLVRVRVIMLVARRTMVFEPSAGVTIGGALV